MYTILLVTHTILVIFLIVLVLIQRTDSDGLSGLGGGGNQFLTGRAKGNLMTRATAILALLFMTTSLILAIMAGNMSRTSIVDKIDSEQSGAASATDSNNDLTNVNSSASEATSDPASKNATGSKNSTGALDAKKSVKETAPAVPKGE